jgi:hypothetical protein
LTRRCSYAAPLSHGRGDQLAPERFPAGPGTYCRDCKTLYQRQHRAKQAARHNERVAQVRAPQYMDDEDTAPGVPPPRLDDPSKPDLDAYAEPSEAAAGLFAHRLLAIGDMHVPRHHPSAVEFLRAIKAEFDPDVVVQVGDETDFHGLSFHERDPNLPGISQELAAARTIMRGLQELFPRMHLLESNHGSLLYRQALHHGIPNEMVRTYQEVLQVGAGWSWRYELRVQTRAGVVHLEHGQKATARTMSRQLGCNVIQGHRHAECYVDTWHSWEATRFAAQTGALINNADRAFWYNRKARLAPVIASVVVLDGEPVIVRLNEAKSGQWDRRLVLQRAA